MFQVIPSSDQIPSLMFAVLCTAANLVPFHASWDHSPGMWSVLWIQVVPSVDVYALDAVSSTKMFSSGEWHIPMTIPEIPTFGGHILWNCMVDGVNMFMSANSVLV